jgi:hypothetical protein
MAAPAEPLEPALPAFPPVRRDPREKVKNRPR